MDVRLDKWLDVACIFKTRSQASRACALNRVCINGQPAKSHRKLQLGDRLEVRIGDWTRILIVRELRGRSVSKAVARTLYEDLSPERPKLDLIDRLMSQPAAQREKGSGRPTKRQRRRIEDWEGRG